MKREIFVFGSNIRGLHAGGSARYALEHRGAVYGIGVGLQGDSYAIPTLDADFRVLPLQDIEQYVSNFLDFAQEHSNWRFNIVAIGCGIAGYKPEQIAPMFKDAPENCVLPEEFKRALEAV